MIFDTNIELLCLSTSRQKIQMIIKRRYLETKRQPMAELEHESWQMHQTCHTSDRGLTLKSKYHQE